MESKSCNCGNCNCNLELGNLMFNTNKNQKYTCPPYIIALLRDIERELERVIFNTEQNNDYDSPFQNSANSFKIENIFEVQAYSWNDEVSQEYNFIYYVDKTKANMPDLKISWYKYLGRDTTMNQEIDPSVMISIYNDCIKALRQYESKELKEQGIDWNEDIEGL